MEITFDVIPMPLALRDSEAVPHTHESRKLASALSLEELTTLLRDRLPPEVDPRAVALRRHGSSFSVSISAPSTDTFAVLEVLFAKVVCGRFHEICGCPTSAFAT